jgi:hypothetical protein
MPRFVSLVAVGIVALAVGVLPQSAEATPVLTLTPSTATVAVGDLFSLDLNITGGEDVAAFQFQLAYDATIVSNSQTHDSNSSNSNGDLLDDDLGFFTSGDIISPSGDLQHSVTRFISNLNLDASGTDAARLVSFGFVAVGPGITTISVFFDETLFDGLWDPFNVSLYDGTRLDATITVSDTAPTPVPEPGTLTLLALGGVAVVRSRIRLRADSRSIR